MCAHQLNQILRPSDGQLKNPCVRTMSESTRQFGDIGRPLEPDASGQFIIGPKEKSVIHFHPTTWWISSRANRRAGVGFPPRPVLHRLLLGSYAAAVRWWHHESFLDCSTRNPCAARESYPRRPDYRSTRWRSLRAGRRMDVDSKCLNTPLTRASPACFNEPTDVRFWHFRDLRTCPT